MHSENTRRSRTIPANPPTLPSRKRPRRAAVIAKGVALAALAGLVVGTGAAIPLAIALHDDGPESIPVHAPSLQAPAAAQKVWTRDVVRPDGSVVQCVTIGDHAVDCDWANPRPSDDR